MKFQASTSFALALAASLAPSSLSHGFLSSIAIDGKAFAGNVPNQGNASSPIRVIDDITPVKGASNRDINCGKNALIADMVAPANPGSVISFDWHSGENTKVRSSRRFPALLNIGDVFSEVATQHRTDVDVHGCLR